ncbi:MAG: HEAT repeat domain-containing protein, partial [Candidatus Poribacteria bacterium]
MAIESSFHVNWIFFFFAAFPLLTGCGEDEIAELQIGIIPSTALTATVEASRSQNPSIRIMIPGAGIDSRFQITDRNQTITIDEIFVGTYAVSVKLLAENQVIFAGQTSVKISEGTTQANIVVLPTSTGIEFLIQGGNVDALVTIGQPAVSALIEILQDERKVEQIRRNAADALERIATPDALDALSQFKSSKEDAGDKEVKITEE